MLLTRSPLVYPRRGLTARLACVKHAASVRPEPGSNSPTKTLTKQTKTNWHKTKPNPTKQGQTKNTRHTVEFSKDTRTPSQPLGSFRGCVSHRTLPDPSGSVGATVGGQLSPVDRDLAVFVLSGVSLTSTKLRQCFAGRQIAPRLRTLTCDKRVFGAALAGRLERRTVAPVSARAGVRLRTPSAAALTCWNIPGVGPSHRMGPVAACVIYRHRRDLVALSDERCSFRRQAAQHGVVGRQVGIAVGVGSTIIAPGRPLVLPRPLDEQRDDHQQQRQLPGGPGQPAAELLVAQRIGHPGQGRGSGRSPRRSPSWRSSAPPRRTRGTAPRRTPRPAGPPAAAAAAPDRPRPAARRTAAPTSRKCRFISWCAQCSGSAAGKSPEKYSA